MTRWTLIAALTLPTLVACGDKEEGEDEDGGTDVGENPSFGGNNPGTTGTSGGAGTSGASGTSGAASTSSTSGWASVVGEHDTEILSNGWRGTWRIVGEETTCSGCQRAFDADFLVQAGDFGADFRTIVFWTNDNYVYGFNSDYWGYGGVSSSFGYWSGYSSNGAYYYAGYVDFY